MNIISIDLEDWFHIMDNNSTKSIQEWVTYPTRIEIELNKILLTLADSNKKATLFCLGWIAGKYPELIKRISAQGHEIASHSMMHQLVYEQTPELFKEDLFNSINLLEDITGKKVRIYRAPGFSITEKTPWAFDALIEAGIEIDCSIFPAERGHGGFPSIKRAEPFLIERNNCRIKEFPINTKKILGQNIIFSGGGYFRLLPYKMIKSFTSESEYVMTYFHPRDFDPDQPVIKDLPLMRRFKSYVGLKGAYKKFETYLSDFTFVDVCEADKMVDWNNAPVVSLD